METGRVLLTVLLLVAPWCAGADPAFYLRKPAWQETMIASREALVTFEDRQAAQAKAAALPRGVEMGPWFSVGPFAGKTPHGFRDAFAPEREVDLGKPCEGGLSWVKRSNWDDGEPNELTGGASAVTYLSRTFTCHSEQSLPVRIGADDGLTVWWNGEKLLARDDPGVHASLKLHLKAGENRLLVKVNNIGGNYSFSFEPGRGLPPKRRSESRELVWTLLQRDFTDPAAQQEMRREREDGIWNRDWTPGDQAGLTKRYAAATQVAPFAAQARNAKNLPAVRELYHRSRAVGDAIGALQSFPFDALTRAVNDLRTTFGAKYPKAADYLARLDSFRKSSADVQLAAARDAIAASEQAAKLAEQLRQLQRDALVANPLLDFDRLLFVKRRGTQLGLPQNWQGNCALPRGGYEDELCVLSPPRPDGRLTTLFKPEGGNFVGDVDLHFDATRLMFSSLDPKKRWAVFEIQANGAGLRRISPPEEPDVDWYDPCYLPDGRVLFAGTACFQGVPCVGGGNTVANLFQLDPGTGRVRQLTFDQEHNWCPAVLNDGRVLYSRWEYTDSPHYFTRLLFHMNPDGTGQGERYGSNSYWPNSTFYARPIPGSPSKIVGVISGHHGVPRMGELILFDTDKDRHEAGGAVQRIPGFGKPVEPVIRDALVQSSWPKFLHPYPLSEKYFLVSCQPSPQSPWGLYLADVFDNLLLIQESPGYALFEPLPFRPAPRPPLVPDRVDPAEKTATVYLSNIYTGPGLQGVPRGTVKKLRVIEYHYAYPHMGGHIQIGVDGPWDVHRILGTVPVESDGSAAFRVPANTPLAVQPLDAEGKALQVMRSWFSAMPGETLSCVGCHEKQQTSPPPSRPVALTRMVSDIQPWHGPARGFSFVREVQPVLDTYCTGCHDGKTPPNLADISRGERNFTKSYLALHPYVRRPGPESDYHLQVPGEWHADTSELVQMLRAGHHGVKLDAEAWDRLVTWIDLNVPDHGTWSENRDIASNFHQRRLESRAKYANRTDDPEAYPSPSPARAKFVPPAQVPNTETRVSPPAGWPFDAAEAKHRQIAAALPVHDKVALSDKLNIDLVLIPAGEFAGGAPHRVVRIEKSFYMSAFEVSNEQFAAFDPKHDSGYVSVTNKDQSTRGEAVNRPHQPVVRVSWRQAMAFCDWVSAKTGRQVTLPSETQWEWACRAGTSTPLSFGDCGADFSKFGNLADERVLALCRGDSPKWIPHIDSVNDGAPISNDTGRYAPNAWGLFDMHGNAAEWTSSEGIEGRKIVCGGSWYDRPARCASSFRLSYPDWQRVFNAGFRIICEPRPGENAGCPPSIPVSAQSE